VIASQGISAEELAIRLEVEQHSVERNLAAMEREGFLYQENSGYMVRGSKKKG
jgi:DNA-binding transcriptional regulator YhcF (GntR family)